MSGASNETRSDSRVFPIYLLLDVSASMMGIVDALNESLDGLLDYIESNPLLGAHTWIGIISFADDARLEMPLTPADELERFPSLSARSGTNYAAGFDLLATLISEDLARLKSEGHRVNRPAVFFMTDGVPTGPEEHWLASLAQLKALPVQIFAIGFRSADPNILSQIATDPRGAFLGHISLGPHRAVGALSDLVREVLNSTTRSIVAGSDRASINIPSSVVPIVISEDDLSEGWIPSNSPLRRQPDA